MINSTQEWINIKDIKDGIIILKSGDMAVVVETSAVNFGLLSANEQIAIIASYAGMLNSLSFPIQILIRSKKLDISSYLKLLDDAQRKQDNPLLFQMMGHYRAFIDQVIRENEVLDKQFFVVIPLWSYEVNLIKPGQDSFKKALNTLAPRRDHIMRQLTGIGLKARQLESEELVKLIYDILNEHEHQFAQIQQQEVIPVQETKQIPSQVSPGPSPVPTRSEPIESVITQPKYQTPTIQRPLNPQTPFIVEELVDDFNAI